MNRDQIAIRITQLQTLHAQINNVTMEAKKLYVPVNPTFPLNAESGVVEILETAKVAVKGEIDALRKNM